MTDVVMLMKYLEVLMKLQDSGYSCRTQVYDVLQELHKQMGFDECKVKISSKGGISISGGTIVHPNTIAIDESWSNSINGNSINGNSINVDKIAKEITASLKKITEDKKKEEINIFDIHG